MKISETDKKWVEETWKKFENKISAVADRTGDKIPYTTKDGRFDDRAEKEIDWWTNGFWPGLMVLMYEATKDEKYLEIERRAMKKLDKALSMPELIHHDVGFMWNISSGADWRLTGDTEQYHRLLTAANSLMGRYNLNGKFIRAWNNWGDDDSTKGWAIIDCMMNIPMLYRVSEAMGDDRYKMIAMSHADTTMQYHVRPDGSCHHIVEYDPINGEGFITNHTGQGFDGYKLSSWSRGQAWAVYGFALSYSHTKKQEYLDTAKKAAHYFISNLAISDWLPLCDFRSPDEPVIYDSTAGACAACGLIEIANNVDPYEQKLYLKAALNILKAMDKSFCDYGDDTDYVLGMGTEQYKCGHHMSIIYGDFFFAEALHKLRGFENNIW